LTTTLICEDRGCTCGVLMPQGPMKPNVMETPVPMRAGKSLRSALTVCPPVEEETCQPLRRQLCVTFRGVELTFTLRDGAVWRRVAEVIDEVVVIGEEANTIHSRGRKL
jgi:hypothetical protein